VNSEALHADPTGTNHGDFYLLVPNLRLVSVSGPVDGGPGCFGFVTYSAVWIGNIGYHTLGPVFAAIVGPDEAEAQLSGLVFSDSLLFKRKAT
jgi:hypothetical protein